MKNILSYFLILPLLFLYSHLNGQAHHCKEHAVEAHQKLIFQNEDYKALFTNKYFVQDAEGLPLSDDLGYLDLDKTATIVTTFENFKDIISYLDKADTDHIEGIYSRGLLSLKKQLVDSVSNYLIIDRIPDPQVAEAFQLNIELQTIKQGVVLARTLITYRQVGGLNFTNMEQMVSEKAIEEVKDSKNKFRVYPVPTADQLVIKGRANPTQIELIDIQGRVVMTQKDVDVRKRKLNLEHLPTGQYFLRIVDSRTQLMEIHKVIKL